MRFKISRFIDYKKSARDNARIVIPLLVARAVAQGREPLVQKDPQFLHGFRVELKRVRDTVNLFEPWFGLHQIRFVQILAKLLRILGELNDVMTAREVLLKGRLLCLNPKIEHYLEERVLYKVAEFARLWQATLGDDRNAASWVNYFAGQSGLTGYASALNVNFD